MSLSDLDSCCIFTHSLDSIALPEDFELDDLSGDEHNFLDRYHFEFQQDDDELDDLLFQFQQEDKLFQLQLLMDRRNDTTYHLPIMATNNSPRPSSTCSGGGTATHTITPCTSPHSSPLAGPTLHKEEPEEPTNMDCSPSLATAEVSSYSNIVVIEPITNKNKYVQVTDNDVLFGRGSGSNGHPGNQWYRLCTLDYQEAYKILGVDGKRALVHVVVFEVEQQRGRFLACDKPPKGPACYYVASKQQVYNKVSRALRGDSRVSNHHS